MYIYIYYKFYRNNNSALKLYSVQDDLFKIVKSDLSLLSQKITYIHIKQLF